MSRRDPRPEWAAIDVDLFDDPKMLELKPQEQLVYIASILWTVKNLTDGYMPTAALPKVGANRAMAGVFVSLGLWQKVTGGWQLSAWDKWQKPKAEWLKLLEHRRQSAALGNCQRWHEEWCRCLEGGVPVPKSSQERSQMRSQVRSLK